MNVPHTHGEFKLRTKCIVPNLLCLNILGITYCKGRVKLIILGLYYCKEY